MHVINRVTDGATVTGTTALKAGTVLEKDGATNYKVLAVAGNADAILMQDVTPTTTGVVTVALFGGVVELAEQVIVPSGITVAEIKPVLRAKGIYIKGA